MSDLEYIRLKNVNKQYGQGPMVLQSLNLTVHKGEFIALIGPSGCGKSTLLKLIANLTAKSSGEIHIGGGDEQSVNKKLGFVFQDANLLPWLTVQDNIGLPLKLQGASSKEVDHMRARLVDLVALKPAATHYPKQLSGGMKMRVSIARALSTQPELLLLDEPFGALDEMTRDDLNEALLQLREKNPWTALFVTHSVTEAVFLASRVIVMSANPGQIYREIDIPFAYPRTADLRSAQAFSEKLREVTEALHSLRPRKPAIAL